LAEERAFLKDYTIPFVQLDPLKTILVFSHIHNTFDKKRLLENPHPDYLKESPKTIDMFIRGEKEAHIKKFFLEDIEELLSNYEPGEPKMKPEVLKQTKQLAEERKKMAQERNATQPNNGSILLQSPGKEPVPLSNEQIVELLQNQHNEIEALKRRNAELEEMINQLQRMKPTHSKPISGTSSTPSSPPTVIPSIQSKSNPEIQINI
jgi:hypothetical protein